MIPNFHVPGTTFYRKHEWMGNLASTTTQKSVFMNNIVIDLDGTLLRSDKTVSEKSRVVLGQLINSGKRIIIATARPPRAVYHLLPDELRALEMIFYNGALVQRQRQTIFEDSLPTALAANVREILKTYPGKAIFGFEQNDWLYTNGSFGEHWLPIYYTEVDLDTFEIEKPAKVLVDLRDTELLDYLKIKLPTGCHLVVTDGNMLGQIMNRGVSKYAALLALIENADEVVQQTLCFGDDVNDVDLFRHCAHSVAMANAVEEIRSLARYSALSNDQDGVARFLSDYFFAAQ